MVWITETLFIRLWNHALPIITSMVKSIQRETSQSGRKPSVIDDKHVILIATRLYDLPLFAISGLEISAYHSILIEKVHFQSRYVRGSHTYIKAQEQVKSDVSVSIFNWKLFPHESIGFRQTFGQNLKIQRHGMRYQLSKFFNLNIFKIY